MKGELEMHVARSNKLAISPIVEYGSNNLRELDLSWRPEAISSVSCVSTDGNRLIACGDRAGSITLLDISSGRELNTLYGHSGAVNGMIFITTNANGSAARCSLLYSVSSDCTACLWKLIPSGEDGKGLAGILLTRITDQHSRPITACCWDAQRMHLFTAGLDGYVRLYAIRQSLSGDADGDRNCASGLDIDSFKKCRRHFSTNKQPINTMTLTDDNVAVGCWNGSLWLFDANLDAPPSDVCFSFKWTLFEFSIISHIFLLLRRNLK